MLKYVKYRLNVLKYIVLDIMYKPRRIHIKECNLK